MNHLKPNSTRTISSRPGKQSGLSLIELMIASVIGLVLLSGVVTIFSSNSASSKMSTGMTRLQDSGRVALDLLSYGVRMTGYEGCRDESKDPVQVLASTGPTINFPDNAVWGSEVDNSGVWDPTIHSDLDGSVNGISSKVRNNTDVLYLQYGSGRSAVLSSDMTSDVADVILPNNPDHLRTGDLIMIADCVSTNIFRATDVTEDATTGITTIQHSNTANSQTELTQAFQGTGNTNAVPVRVMRFESVAYYVGDSGRKMPDGSEVWSLFELDTTTPDSEPTELIEGVEDFQVLYGVQPDPSAASAIRYIPAEDVTNFGQVVSVQLGLLISTPEYSATTDDTQTYNIAGTTIDPPSATGTNAKHPGDRRLRASFNATIQIRNRLL